MIPQVPNNNRGIWKQLETKVRDYVLKNNDVYVVSGPIYEKGYAVIGNNVGIPTKVYKVIVDVKNQKSAAYIFPNTPLPVADLEKYKLSITEAEKIININFNPKLNDSLESKNNWSH
jgi:endonuclease G